MTVSEFAARMGAEIPTGEAGLDKPVRGVYAGDLLSWVMAHASPGDAWITVHTNLNVVAVALLAEAACIVIPEGIPIEAGTVEKAVQEGIPMLSTPLSAYQICCRACQAGIP